MILTFPQYMKYIKFACDEELERLHEFLYCMDNNQDDSEEKYYIAYPADNCPPSKFYAEKQLDGRSMEMDFAIMDSDREDSRSREEREELYAKLRKLLLY